MKKIVGIAILLLVFGSILCGTVSAVEEPFGPAPNSGDGDPDGSGFHDPTVEEPWANDGSPGDVVGPAPGAGDGVSDGPEWP